MNQKNPFSKQEDQPQDSMDDAGLDFQLNAAIESNPFQKRRANKAAVGQSTEVPKPQTTTSYSTVQKSTENITPTTSTTALAYKKTTYPEPIKSNTEVLKKEEVPTQQYQRPTYPTTTQTAQPQQASVSQVEPGKVNPTPYTPYTQTSAYKTPIPANITRTVPTTVSQPTSTINPVQGTTATIPATTAQINRPDLTKPTTVPPVQSGQTSQNERPLYTSALGSLVGTTQANKPVTTTPPYTQVGLNKEVPPTSTLGSTTTGTTGITSVPKPELNKPTTVVPPTQQTQNERPPFASALSSLTGGARPPVTQPGAGVQVNKPEIARPTTVTPPTTGGILNKDTVPPTGDKPPTSSALGGSTTVGITSTAKPTTTVTTTTSPPVQNERPPTTSALGNLIGQRTTATTVPTQGVTQPSVVTPTKTPVTTTVNQETPPPGQGEKSIASALGSLVGQTGSATKTEYKPVPPTFMPPATKTPVTVIPRSSPTKLVTPAPIVQTQTSTLVTRPKQDPVTQSREMTKMAQTPKKIFATFNNNRGFMLVGSKIKGKTVDVQATRLGPLILETLAYPGPYKFDKKTLGDKKIELSKFLEKKLTDDNKASLPYKLSLQLLNEYLNNNSTNIFTTQDNSQSKEKISQELHRHSLEQSLTTVAKEYTEFFNFSNNYLSDLNNPSVQDANGEDLLFKALFLRNTAFNIDPANIDYILHYVKSRFAPGDPLHTVSMVKLSLFHEIFETEFFLESDINDLWPIWIYPCLRYSDFIPIHQVRDFLNSFALKILERKNNYRYGMVSLFVAMLSGDFDLETFDRILQSSRNTEFIQVLETYYYVLKATNPNYDKNYDVIPKVLPLLLRYASSLVDMGMFERGKEYLDYIVALRPFYKGLEGNITFLSQVRILRDFVVNNYTLIEEAKNAQKQQTNFLSNIASKKDMATNAIKNIQAKSKGIFGFMGSALSNFINANEAANASDNNEEDLKQAETSSASTSESIFSTLTKPNVDTTKVKPGAPPQQEVIQPPPVHSPTHDFQIEEGGEQVKVDPSKQGKNFMSNPFASKTGGPAPSQGDNSSTRKGIPKNRYVPI